MDDEVYLSKVNTTALIIPIVVVFLLQIILFGNELVGIFLGSLILGWILYDDHYIGIIMNGIILGIIGSLFYYISHLLIGVNSPNIVIPNILGLIILAPIITIVGAVIRDKYANDN